MQTREVLAHKYVKRLFLAPPNIFKANTIFYNLKYYRPTPRPTAATTPTPPTESSAQTEDIVETTAKPEENRQSTVIVIIVVPLAIGKYFFYFKL